MNIALIPARFGSKRIKNKNIKLFFNKPIISYSINLALKSRLFSRVIVSTENKRIAKISRYYGAEVPFFRPIKLAGNNTTTISVIKHAIKCLVLNKKKNTKICCIYPVAPLIDPKLLIHSYKKFIKQKADFSVTLLKKKKFNKKMFYINKAGLLKKVGKKGNNKNILSDAGQFYWGKNSSFLKYQSMFNGKVTPILIGEDKAIDVNTYADWKRLTKLYKKNRS